MKTIISIDFDIIMEPSIEQYNFMVPKLNWTTLKQLPYLEELEYNKNFYNKIKEYIKKYPKNKKIFIKEHDEIAKYITEKCYLINIDHHHDCGYKNNGSQLSCANWLGYLYNKQLIENKPIWYCDKHSTTSPVPDWIEIKDFENEDIPLGDLLIIANSVPWIPPEYQPLFEELKKL